MNNCLLKSLVVFIGLHSVLSAAHWPNWRGPNHDGSSPEKNLPAEWTKEKARWATPLPGPSAATPAVWGSKIFVSSLDTASRDLVAMALDRETGKVLWKEVTGSGAGGDTRSNKASPSPIADVDRAYFYYGSGDLAAFDHKGKKIWSRNIQTDYGKYAFLWTYSSSPLLYEGKLYIPVMQRDVSPRGGEDGEKNIPSFLLALDPSTGKTLWKVDRPSDANAESRESFTTPIPMQHGGRKEIVLVGGDCITGHAPDDGRELWRWGSWNPSKVGHWRLVPSAAYGDGVVLASAPKGGSIFAFKAGGKGKLSDDSIAWKTPERKITTDVCTPLFYQGRFYILDGDAKVISCLDPKNGQPVWSEKIQSKSIFRGSPTAADGKIYAMNHGGDVFVFQAGEQFKQLAQIPMGEGGDEARSSIAISDGQLFIRTQEKLFCIGR